MGFIAMIDFSKICNFSERSEHFPDRGLKSNLFFAKPTYIPARRNLRPETAELEKANDSNVQAGRAGSTRISRASRFVVAGGREPG